MISRKRLSGILKLSLLLGSCQPRIRDVPVVTPRTPAESPASKNSDDSVIILPEMILPADKGKIAMTLQQMYASLPEYKGEYSSEDSDSWVANVSVLRGVICLQGEKASLEIIPQLEEPEREQASASDEEFFQQLNLIAEHMRTLDPVLSQRIHTFVRDFTQQTLFSDFPLTELIIQQDFGSLVLKPYQKDCRIALGAINHAIMVGGNRFERYIWRPLWQHLTPPEKVQRALIWLSEELGLMGLSAIYGRDVSPYLTYLAKLQAKSYQITDWVQYASSIDAIGGKYLYPYGELWLDATMITMDEGGMISGWVIDPQSPPQIRLGSVLLNDEERRDTIEVSFKGGKIKTMASYGKHLSIFLGDCELKTNNYPWNIEFLDEAHHWFALDGTFELGPCLASLGIIRESENESYSGPRFLDSLLRNVLLYKTSFITGGIRSGSEENAHAAG